MEKLLRVNFDLSIPSAKKRKNRPYGTTLKVSNSTFQNVDTSLLEKVEVFGEVMKAYSAKCAAPKVKEAKQVIHQSGCRFSIHPNGLFVRYDSENSELVKGLKAIGASVTYLEKKNSKQNVERELVVANGLKAKFSKFISPLIKRIFG